LKTHPGIINKILKETAVLAGFFIPRNS